MMNLEKLGLTSGDLPLRSQLSSILGGNGDASLEPGGGSGTCGALLANGEPFCGMDKASALDAHSKNEGSR